MLSCAQPGQVALYVMKACEQQHQVHWLQLLCYTKVFDSDIYKTCRTIYTFPSPSRQVLCYKKKPFHFHSFESHIHCTFSPGYPEASVSEEGAEITTPGTGCDSCVWDGKTVEYIPRDGCEHFP